MPSMAVARRDHRRRRSQRDASQEGELRQIAGMLERRGFTFVEANPADRLVLPDDLTTAEEDDFYEEMKRYSSRIILRDLIQHHRGALERQRFARPAVAARLLERLAALRVVEVGRDGAWRLRRPKGRTPAPRPLHSFGETLEWFVAQVFRRELGCPAAWGVVVRGNDAGGDLDVVSLVEDLFVLAEVKSSPPKHVDLEVIGAFLTRVAAIRPHAAFFVEDTELRMTDKIVPFFEEALAERGVAERFPIARLEHELFVVGEGIYVVNSRSDLVANLRTCVAHFLRGRGIADLGG